MGAHTAIAATAIAARQDSPNRTARNRTVTVPNKAATMMRAGMAAFSGSPRNNSECHASTNALAGLRRYSKVAKSISAVPNSSTCLRISRVRDQIEGSVGWQGEESGARWRPSEQVHKNIDDAERGKPLSDLLILVKRSEPRLQPPEPDRYQPPESGAENQRDVNDGDVAARSSRPSTEARTGPGRQRRYRATAARSATSRKEEQADRDRTLRSRRLRPPVRESGRAVRERPHASKTLAHGCVIKVRKEQIVQLGDIVVEDGLHAFLADRVQREWPAVLFLPETGAENRTVTF